MRSQRALKESDSLVHSFNKYVWSIYPMPGSAVGIGYIAMSKTKFTAFMNILVQVLGNRGSQIKSCSLHVSVKKKLLKHRHNQLFTYCL